jgi:hypothetical protein
MILVLFLLLIVFKLFSLFHFCISLAREQDIRARITSQTIERWALPCEILDRPVPVLWLLKTFAGKRPSLDSIYLAGRRIGSRRKTSASNARSRLDHIFRGFAGILMKDLLWVIGGIREMVSPSLRFIVISSLVSPSLAGRESRSRRGSQHQTQYSINLIGTVPLFMRGSNFTIEEFECFSHIPLRTKSLFTSDIFFYRKNLCYELYIICTERSGAWACLSENRSKHFLTLFPRYVFARHIHSLKNQRLQTPVEDRISCVSWTGQWNSSKEIYHKRIERVLWP